jgi:predicted transcriptional regulator of viral defense system
MQNQPQKNMRWRDALVAKVLTERNSPIVSNYWVAVKLFELVHKGSYDERPLQLPKRPVDGRMLAEARNALLYRGVLTQDKMLPKTLFRIPDVKNIDQAETMCAIDPFGYVAFLSAMAYHGLTNRLPKILYFISPEPGLWRSLADEKMQKDLGGLFELYRQAELPLLRHSKVEKLDGMLIEQIRTKTIGGWRNARDGALRVTGIGRTFLDMLQRADLCGGIRHVLEVFEESASPHLSAIIAELNMHGTKVDRVRAGYILEEYCHLSDPRIDTWTIDASRGGSRKLDPQSEYSSNFSEKWALSINV